MLYAPLDDFELSVTTIDDGAFHPMPGRGPRILVCSDGELELATATGSEILRRGEAVFVAPSDLTRANRLVTFFEPVEDGAGGLGEVGVEREALAVDVDGR